MFELYWKKKSNVCCNILIKETFLCTTVWQYMLCLTLQFAKSKACQLISTHKQLSPHTRFTKQISCSPGSPIMDWQGPQSQPRALIHWYRDFVVHEWRCWLSAQHEQQFFLFLQVSYSDQISRVYCCLYVELSLRISIPALG